MQKRIISEAATAGTANHSQWLDVEKLADVEVTSEANGYPIESVFSFGAGPGWRAASPGKQVETERTQEFTIKWSPGGSTLLKNIVRQQWNFSPNGSTSEREEYEVDLKETSFVELSIDPDRGANQAVAKLTEWRFA